MKIKYNSPVILTYTMLSISVLAFCSNTFLAKYFSSPSNLSFFDPLFLYQIGFIYSRAWLDQLLITTLSLSVWYARHSIQRVSRWLYVLTEVVLIHTYDFNPEARPQEIVERLRGIDMQVMWGEIWWRRSVQAPKSETLLVHGRYNRWLKLCYYYC